MFDEFDKTFGGVFPSPIGELHFSIIIRLFKTIKTERFRPLSGSYISQLRQEREENLGKWHVSVPYRGATFLNANEKRKEKIMNSFRPLSGSYISQLMNWFRLQEIYSVSVPYRGATFLNLKAMFSLKSKITGFRPLSGSYISQLLKKKMHKNTPIVSVPYRGATFLNAQRASIQRWLHSVSVPYRGATFLNHQLTTRQYCIIGFRPLSGSYISQ